MPKPIKFTVQDVAEVLRQAEQAGYITEMQVAQLSGLFVARSMLILAKEKRT